MGLWGVELWEKSPWSWILQRNELSLMPSTGMVAPGPGTCCSAGDHKMRACLHLELDAASGIQAWKGCQSDALQDPWMQWDFQQQRFSEDFHTRSAGPGSPWMSRKICQGGRAQGML